MPYDRALWTKPRQDAVTGVVGPVLHGDRSLQHRADALAQVRAVCILTRQRGVRTASTSALFTSETSRDPIAGKDVAFQAAEPVGRLPGAAPATPLLLDHGDGGLREGGHGLSAALVGEGVAPRAGELPVGKGLLASVGERDQTDAAESELVFPAADDETLDPAAGSGTLVVEVEAIAVRCRPTGAVRTKAAAHGGG